MPLVFALLTMLVCAGGIVENAWPGFARLVGDRPDHVTARTEVWAAAYLAAAVVASFASARFQPTVALARLPLVVAVGSVGVILLLLLLVAGHAVGGMGGDATGGDEAAPGPVDAPKNLAAAVLPPEDAQHALGAPVEPPDTTGSWVTRVASLCRYRTTDRSASLTLVVHDRMSKPTRSRLWRRAEPVGVGEEAVATDRSVFASAGEWSIALTAWRRDRQSVDRAPLLEAAERVLGRLPQPYEVEAYERRLFTGWRSLVPL